MAGFHFIFQLQDRAEFFMVETPAEAAEFCDRIEADMGDLACIRCYMSNLLCYIALDVGLIEPKIRSRVLGKIQAWLNDAYQVGTHIEV